MDEPIIIRDRKTGTLWERHTTTRIGKKTISYSCEICGGSSVHCCGCGGMSCMYPNLFDCCSKSVCCPNCTLLLPIEDSRCISEHNYTVVADISFKVAVKPYRKLLKEYHICYSKGNVDDDSDYEKIPEERVKYLPRINNDFLLYYVVDSVTNESAPDDEETEDDEEDEDAEDERVLEDDENGCGENVDELNEKDV